MSNNKKYKFETLQPADTFSSVEKKTGRRETVFKNNGCQINLNLITRKYSLGDNY